MVKITAFGLALSSAVLAATLFAGPGSACDVRPSEPKFQARTAWQSGPLAHPLLGKIVNAATPDCNVGLPGVITSIQATLTAGGIVLLGETHDNGEHHWLRALLIEGIVWTAQPGTMPRPGLVFEHLRADQDTALAAFKQSTLQAKTVPTVDAFFRAVDWEKSGWPEERLYAPLFRAALNTGWPILSGDPPRAMVRAVARSGLSALSDGQAAVLRLDQPLPAALQESLLTELEGSHCGLMPKSAFGNMAVAQRYRDAHLATQLIAAATQHGSAILFAGNGHVRTDRGVPYGLKTAAAGRAVLAVQLIEVEPGKNAPQAYLPRQPDGTPAADVIIFTPRVEREDPCVAMRAQFGKKG